MSSAVFDDAADLYQRIILERSRSPHHMHRLEPFDTSAKGDNPMCGDRVEVRLRCEAGRIAEVAFEARGCAISIASADLMSEAVAGLTPAEVRDASARFHAMAQELPVAARDAIMAVPGVTGCDVETVWEPAWDPSRMSEEARLALNMF